MSAIATTVCIPLGGEFQLFDRPNPKELPYMIDILKEIGKASCEEEYSLWVQNLEGENKLSLVSRRHLHYVLWMGTHE